MIDIMSFLVLFLSIISLVHSQTPTSQPTPDCDTFTITIQSWNDTNESLAELFEGVYQKTTDLVYDRPTWEVKSNTDKRLYLLSTNWAIQTVKPNDDFDYLIYYGDDYFPPEGLNEWTHGSIIHAAQVFTNCSDTFAPSLSPSSMPTYIPSSDPTHNPSFNPSLSPSYMPSPHPSTMPTNNPTVLPTPSCSIIELLAVNYSSVLNVNDSITASSAEQEVIMGVDGWVFWPMEDELNDRPQWMYPRGDGTESGSDDEFMGYLYYDGMWTLEVNVSSFGEIVTFVDTSMSIRKVPLLTSDWTGDTIIAEFEFMCYESWYPSTMPSYMPSSEPTEEPSLAPSEMPTEPSMVPTYAPTYECNELYVSVIGVNYNIFNESGEYVTANPPYIDGTSIAGTYVLQDNLVNNRPWYQLNSDSNIWIEWDDGAWYLFNPTETDISSLQTLYYVSNDKEPPMDEYTNGTVDTSAGFWWLTFERLNDGTENVKEFELYITCKLITNPPTSGPVDPPPTTTDEMIIGMSLIYFVW